MDNLPNWKFIRQNRKVYIMVGINDCTLLDLHSHTVRLVTPFTSGLYVLFKSLLTNLEDVFKCEFPTVKLTICPLYGQDISVYNKSHMVKQLSAA